jgi:hypothetical protein
MRAPVQRANRPKRPRPTSRSVRLAALMWRLEEVGQARGERGDWAGAHAAFARVDAILKEGK